MISICVLFFVVMLYFVDIIFCALDSKISNFQIKKFIIFKYLIVLIFFFIIFFTPCYEGFSLIVLCYSLFDSTSIFCVILLLFLCFKIVCKDFVDSISLQKNTESILHQTHLQNFTIYTILATLGFTLYAHTLNLTNIDIYHGPVLIHTIIALITITAMYITSKIHGILMLTALIPSIFGQYNYSILEFLICPYLWIFSLFYIIISPLLALKTLNTKRISKR